MNQADPNIYAPTFDLELERSLVGAILSNTEVYPRVSSILKPEHFFNDLCRNVFTASSQAFDEMGHADLTSIMAVLRKSNKLDSVGGIPGLMGLTQDAEMVTNIDLCAGLIHELATRRSVQNLAMRLMTDSKDDSKNIYDVISGIESEATELGNTASTSKAIFSIADCVRSNRELIEEAKQRGDGLAGVTSGYRTIDERLHGFPNGAMIILAARPSVGKTALAVNMLNRMVDNGIKAAFFSYEMTPEALVSRMICTYTELCYSNLRSGSLTDNETLIALKEESRLASQGDRMFICRTDPSITSFRATARQLKKKHDIQCIFVDYLQLLKDKGSNRQEEVSSISRNVKSLALELNIPIVALSQLNRGVTSRNDKTPQLSDLRESGAIEQDADVVMFLHREEYYGQDHTQDTGKTELIIAKQRDGALGPLPLRYVGQYFRFEEPEVGEVLVHARNTHRPGWAEENHVYDNVKVISESVPQKPPMPDFGKEPILPF